MAIVLLGLMLLLSSHPISGVSLMVAVTLMFSFYLYFSVGLFWFSGILLLVMLSGVLVLFTYMASLSPNEVFEMVGGLAGLMVVVYMGSGVVAEWGLEIDGSLMVVKLWDSEMGLMNLYMLVMLLFTMVAVVWMTRVFLGALRV